MSKVVIEVTKEQADAISKALDLYVRIGIGQFDEVAQLVAFGLVPVRNTSDVQRQIGHILCQVGRDHRGAVRIER